MKLLQSIKLACILCLSLLVHNGVCDLLNLVSYGFVSWLFPISIQMWQNEEVSVSGPKIPQALEKILQLKEIRQEQLTDPAGQSSVSSEKRWLSRVGRLSSADVFSQWLDHWWLKRLSWYNIDWGGITNKLLTNCSNRIKYNKRDRLTGKCFLFITLIYIFCQFNTIIYIIKCSSIFTRRKPV